MRILYFFLLKAIILLLIIIIVMLGRLEIEGIPRVTSIEHYYIDIAVKGTVNIPDDLELFRTLARENNGK